VRKVLLLLLAIAAVIIAVISYEKYYARRDISRSLNDARLTASIKTALSLNRHLKNSQIEVSASGGTITLSGAVGTEIQKQLAEEIALSIKSAGKVDNALVVSRALTLAQTAPGRTLGEKLDDLTIEASIKTAFMLNENVNARHIGVSSNQGLVTLTGKVVTPAEAELARKIADDVEGVISVKLNLEVQGDDEDEKKGKRSIIQKVDDARLVTQVRAALMVNRNIDSSEIEVSSRDGIVTITGIVRGGAEKDLAQKIAEDCWGVTGVVNELRIK